MINTVNSVDIPEYRVVLPDAEFLFCFDGLSALPVEWCVWKAEARTNGKKPAKKPFGLHGRGLDAGKPTGWMPFDEAVKLFESGNYDGIGARMASIPEDQELCGLDLDNCIAADGSVKPEKLDIYSDFMRIGGYIEISPSGSGLRQFVIASRPPGFSEKASDLEIYDSSSKRYLTLTGKPWPIGASAGAIVEAQAAVDAFTKQWGKAVTAACASTATAAVVDGGRTVDDVLSLLKRFNKRGKITKLLAGDTSDYAGHSEADIALCAEAAYYSHDISIIDAVIRQSGLYRDKWDEKRGRSTYGTVTIEKALQSQMSFYDDDRLISAAIKASSTAEKARTAAKAKEVLIGGYSDLQTAKGAWKTDIHTQIQLLFRDKRLAGICNYDEFSGMAVFNAPLSIAFNDPAGPDTVGRLQEDHVAALERWFGREWGVTFGYPGAVKKIAVGWARHNRINPLTDRLNALAADWDETPRLDDWLLTYCGAETAGANKVDITEYIRAVGARWIISAVARAFRPGSKVDTMLILEGKQGARKSSAVRALAEALGEQYFREAFTLSGGAHKDAQIALRGRLIVEWGELAGLGKRDHAEIKNFLSLQTDTYRGVYEGSDTDWPRTAVFCGTTNDSEYLVDPTGNRRFWPVSVRKIDIEALRAAAPMLWAEAVIRFKAGERWWFEDINPMDQRLLALAAGEQIHRVGTTIYSEAAHTLAERLVSGNPGEGIKRGAMADTAFSRTNICAWLKRDDVEIDPNDNRLWQSVTAGFRQAGWVKSKSNGLSKWRIGPDLMAKLLPEKPLHGGAGIR